MIASINRLFEHGGRSFHLEVEDLGVEEAQFEVRILDRGGIQWSKRMSYRELLEQGLARHDLELGLRVQMEKTVQVVQAAIAKGRLP